MIVTLIIVGGIVATTLIAVLGDYLVKTRQKVDVDPAVIRELRDRIARLEDDSAERDSRIAMMEGELAFTTRLLEEKHDAGPAAGQLGNTGT